jgi:hypothetical protein
MSKARKNKPSSVRPEPPKPAQQTAPDYRQRFLDWALRTEGSTRAVALMRIGLVLTVWTRWANDLVVFRHLTDGEWLFCAVFFLVTPFALIGLFTRVSVAATALCTLYLVYGMGYAHGVEGYTHHHTTLLAWCCVWLAFTPCGRSYSVDRWLAIRRAEKSAQPWPEERANLWGMRLLALQASSLYFWTALNKCNVGFLSGARMAHYTMTFYTGSSAIDEGSVGALFWLLAWGTTALEFALAFGLFFPRARRYLMLAGLLLHGVFYAVLSVFTFTVTMWILYLAFLDPDQLHRFLDRLQGQRGESEPSARAA